MYRFYVCSGGRPVLFNCLGDLHWNQEIQDCDFPRNSNCEVIQSTVLHLIILTNKCIDLKIPLPVDPDEDKDKPIPTPNCRPGPGVYKFPHPRNCIDYFLCVGDLTPYPRRCAADLIFNPTIEECERPGNFECPH